MAAAVRVLRYFKVVKARGRVHAIMESHVRSGTCTEARGSVPQKCSEDHGAKDSPG